MTRLLKLVAAGLLVVAATGMAAEKKAPLHDQVTGQAYGMAGCGLGSIMFGDKPGIIQVVAGTFNGTAGNQTFGITSGTSNCVDNGGGTKKAELFIIVNKEMLAKDSSRGRGETIDNLAALLECSNANGLGTSLQGEYSRIFPTVKTDGMAVSKSILDLVKQNKALGCKVVG